MKRGDILIGIGAGFVSAVLLATVVSGSIAGAMLSYLAPLPVAIVSLGWPHRTGLLACAACAVVTSLIFDPPWGTVFALAVALPMWWLAFLALLAQDGAPAIAPQGTPVAPHWYPLGMIALWAAGLSVILTFAAALTFGPDYETFRAAVREVVEQTLKGEIAELSGIAPGALPVEKLAGIFALIIIPLLAAASTVVTLVILLVAAKIVALSGRLPRPFPVVSREFVLPRATLIGLAGSLVLAPFSGWCRFVAVTLACAVAVLFALQGLATTHVLLARVPARPFILTACYAMIIIFWPWMLLSLAILGLAEMVLAIRARALAPWNRA